MRLGEIPDTYLEPRPTFEMGQSGESECGEAERQQSPQGQGDQEQQRRMEVLFTGHRPLPEAEGCGLVR